MFNAISSYTGIDLELIAAIVPLLSIVLFDLMYIPQNSPMMANTSAQNNEKLAVTIMVF